MPRRKGVKIVKNLRTGAAAPMKSNHAHMMLDIDEKSEELNDYDGLEEEFSEEDVYLADQTQNTLNSFEPRRSQYLAQHISTTQTEAYNPNQDKQEVLEIRRSYAHLRDELSKNSRELVKADSDRLSQLIDEANSVFNRVHTTSDASLDSRFITDTADLGVEKVHKLPLFVSEFSLDTYLRVMKQYLGNNSWEDLGTLVSSYWTGVDTTDFMLGPMAMESKKQTAPRAQTVKTARVEPAPLIKPTVVNLAADTDNSAELSKETSENVMKVYGILEGIGSYPFYHFITDPNSFARTVENLFYVSFLIRDCRARIFIPEIAASTNELYIEAILDEEEQALKAPDDGNINQMVLGMTPRIWRKSIEKYKIETAFLDIQ